MLKIGVSLIALSLGTATAAFAQPAVDTVLSALTRQGFGAFEVKRVGGQVKIEGYRGAIERELTYDAATGRLIKDEVGRRDDRLGRNDDRRDDRAADRSGDDDTGADDRGRGRDDAGSDDRGRGRGGDDQGRGRGDDDRGGGGDDRGGSGRGSSGRGDSGGGHDAGPSHG